MCLKVFVEGNEEQYEALKPSAMSLGSAFQKLIFLEMQIATSHTLEEPIFQELIW